MTPSDTRHDQAGRYSRYVEWKDWSDFFRLDGDASDYYDRECSDDVVAGSVVLEIGFGAGSFLAWAKSRDAYVCGTEMIAELVGRAEECGIEILPVELETVAEANQARFDAIFSFDVFEHLSMAEISRLLRTIATMLKPGGTLLLRFPNAQSPFGLAPQYGDATHRVALSRGVFEWLIRDSCFEIVRYGGAARPRGIGLFIRIARGIRYAAQDAIAAALNAIYGQSIPWDPVVVLLLRKSSESVGDGVLTESS